MSFQDTWVTCAECGEKFIFRVEDQRRQSRRGEEVVPPELCPSCRSPSRAEHTSRSKPTTERRAQKAEGEVPLGTGPREGSVKWYDNQKGYGFIVDSSGEDLFFHRTGIVPGERPIFPDGTRVTYLVEQTNKGPQAVDVERMDAENGA
jgi:CspA family cold shock protein